MQTPLEVLYQNIWWGVFLAILIASLIGGIIFAIIAGSSFGKGAVIFALILTLSGIGTSFLSANAQAYDAVTAGWQGAINQKATFIQKLHGFFISYEKQTYDCHYGTSGSSRNNLRATGCKYATSYYHCLHRKSNGDCDSSEYEYYPWFRQEFSYYGTLNVYKDATITFGEHLAPPDWQNQSNGWHDPRSFSYGIPVDFTRVQHAVDLGQILGGSVYNDYFNWSAVDDLTTYNLVAPQIPQMLKDGVLPTMPYIKNSGGQPMMRDTDGTANDVVGYDYQFVQFLGGLKVSPQQNAVWQELATDYAAFSGPKLQASIMVMFIPADKYKSAGERNQWIKTAKSWLQRKTQFKHMVLPKNLTLFGCGVAIDMSMIDWCQMETGMFTGNEGVELDVSQLQPFAFTPSNFFGTLKDDASPLKRQDNDNDLIVSRNSTIDFTGGVIDGVLRNPAPDHGFHRVSMSTLLYMRTDIKPDQSQIDDLESTHFWWTLLLVLVIWIVIDGFCIYVASKSSSY